MKTKLLRFLMLLLVGAGMSSVNAQEVIYSWESPDGTVIETGGTAVYMSGPEGADRVNYLNADYYTLCLNGKKAKMGTEASNDGGYIQINLDQALEAGDIISITGYINKDASGKEASIYFKFENGDGVDDPYIFGDADNIHSVVGGAISTHTFTVPANAAGSKFFQMSRNKANTNVFITKLVINKGGDAPIVTIALPTFEVDGVKYESGATVEGLKTGHRVTINVEDGMYIYANWSSKIGNSKDSYYIPKNMKGQTSYNASTSSGGQRVLYAVAGDTDDPESDIANSSDLAYIVFTDVVAADPAFTPAAGEVEVGTVVTLATECKDDKIFYTTDGSDPTAESTAYTTDGIAINENVTIKAIAFDKNGENGSAIVSAAYTVPAPVVIPTPVFAPESGATVNYGDAVTITYDEAYILKYTTDGSDPKESETAMSGTSQPQSVTVDQEGTFTVKAYLSNDEGASDVVTATYTVEGGPIVVGVPTFDPAPGAVEAGTKVTIKLGENAQSIVFTTDGTDPRLNGDQVPRNWTVVINEETTIKAYCQAQVGDKAFNSEIVEATYTIKEPEVLPESNVTFDPSDAMPTIFDAWSVSFLITKTDVKAGDKFTFITEPYEVADWEWGPQILPKNNADWSDLAPALIPDANGLAVLTLTDDMASIINSNGGLRVQGMAIKVLAVQFEAGPDITPEPQGEIVDLIDKFTYTWNENESLSHNGDKSITFNGVQWGGLAAWIGGEDWSAYEKLVFEFAEPTPVNVQGFVQTATPEDIKWWGEPGITKLECPFEGKDMSAVNQVALQLSDPATIHITKIYLVKKSGVEPAPEFALTFNPASGATVEVGDEIELTYDDEAFLLFYTVDGSDPKGIEGDVMSAWGTGEKVTVKGTGEFVIKAYLENRKTNEQSDVFTATYTINAPAIAEVTFSPESGTEVEVDDEITISFDGDNFQCWVTTDGSDPASSLTALNIFPDEAVKVAGEGEFVVKAMLENNKTGEQTQFVATYPIKAAVIAQVTFDPESGTEVEVDDEITISFDGDNFQCWVTTDGSDPASSLTAMNLFPDEAVKVAGEGEFVVKAMLENNKTGEQTFFEAIYPIKAVAPAEVTIATRANGYGTYCSDKDLDFSACDAQAFIARLNGNRVILTEVQEVPAGTGILVKYNGEEVNVPVMENAAPITGVNDFIGVLEDTEVAYGTVSILSVVNGEEGFYKFLGTVIPANKAYFNKVATGSANAKLSFVFDEADGINAIVADAIESGDAYNLNGQRVKKSYKGVVIVNGKKYFKK